MSRQNQQPAYIRAGFFIFILWAAAGQKTQIEFGNTSMQGIFNFLENSYWCQI
jgi:hypothetical protein